MGKSCGGTRCSGPGCARKMEEKKTSFFLRDSEAAFGSESVQGRLVLDQNPPTPVEEGGARKGVPSLRGQTHAAGMREVRPLKPSPAAPRSDALVPSSFLLLLVSATRGSSFSTRIRLGKAVAGSGLRGQEERDQWKTCSGLRLAQEMREQFFSRDSEGAFGMESATRGGSFWSRIRLGKAVAGSGVRSQDERDQWKQTGCARKTEENGWRRVFGAKIGARNERPVFFLGIQRERLAWKVQPGEARFGAELDWVKPWRGQVFGARLCTRNERKVLFL